MKHDLIIIDSEGVCTQKDVAWQKRILMQYISSPQGKKTLAQSMIQPLRTRIDYTGITQKAFCVSPIPAPVNKPIRFFKHKIIGIDSDGECRDIRLIKFPLFETFLIQ